MGPLAQWVQAVFIIGFAGFRNDRGHEVQAIQVHYYDGYHGYYSIPKISANSLLLSADS